MTSSSGKGYDIHEGPSSWYISSPDRQALRVSKRICPTKNDAISWYETNSKAEERTSPAESDTLQQAYFTLGVRPDASDAVIKAAWRALISEFHPDRYNGEDASEKALEINRAYKIISKARSEACKKAQQRSYEEYNNDYDRAQEGNPKSGFKPTPDRSNDNHNSTNSASDQRPVFRWSWGAFFSPLPWAWDNRLWIFIPAVLVYVVISGILVGSEHAPVIRIVLSILPMLFFGIKSDEIAWNTGRYKSTSDFYLARRGWNKWGMIIGIPLLAIYGPFYP